MSDMPSDYMQGTVILNNSNITPEFIQEQYSFIPNSVKVDLFDKESWRPTTRSPFKDELENYDGKNLWLNLWHVMKEQPYQFVVTKEQLQNYYHFRKKLGKMGKGGGGIISYRPLPTPFQPLPLPACAPAPSPGQMPVGGPCAAGMPH